MLQVSVGYLLFTYNTIVPTKKIHCISVMYTTHSCHEVREFPMKIDIPLNAVQYVCRDINRNRVPGKIDVYFIPNSKLFRSVSAKPHPTPLHNFTRIRCLSGALHDPYKAKMCIALFDNMWVYSSQSISVIAFVISDLCGFFYR